MNSARRAPTANCVNKLRDAQATKKKLVHAALLAFSTRGYDAASTRSIETAAGVKRGLINHHYGSKQALWQAAADHMMLITEQDLGGALENIKQIDDHLKLRFLVHAYVTFCAKHPEL